MITKALKCIRRYVEELIPKFLGHCVTYKTDYNPVVVWIMDTRTLPVYFEVTIGNEDESVIIGSFTLEIPNGLGKDIFINIYLPERTPEIRITCRDARHYASMEPKLLKRLRDIEPGKHVVHVTKDQWYPLLRS